ncbi:hypothetical protein WH47_10197 [Habropoda laboriosa]|uniref:Uncharacterized protein n=1 Tax=Habropoda laboriosa TaxID=597456 RepID=A0A0L7R4C5_9HYME|nr:hypothetical protein WH47_10197 [Habropoda laboriosa]
MSETHFANINQSLKHKQKNEKRDSFKRTQTLRRNPFEYSSTQTISEKNKNLGKSQGKNKEQKKRKQNANLDSTSSSTSRDKSSNIGQKIYLWCAQCCRRKKSKITEVRKSKKGFCKRLKKKFKKKKQTTFSRFKDSKERKKSMKKKKGHPSDTSVRTFEMGQDEQLIKDFVPEMDFTKSCCYLCAKSTMAIAAAMSNKTDKLHMSVQASIKERLTSDKSCSPEIHVRTVQSSVKVKMRDMSTLHPERKKSKKKKAKLNLKKLNNMIPKIKFPMYPKVRTVACETDKSMRCNNIPQCRAKRGTHCVTETNITKNDIT